MTQPSEDGRFPSTSWTLIERIRSDDEREAAKALDEICARYHYPLYCYLRRRGLDHHDAEDVLHDFLERFLQSDSFSAAEETKGRLRGYLAVSLSRHLIGWVRHQARRPALAGPDNLDELYQHESFHTGETPEEIFERKWALALLFGVIESLSADYDRRGRTLLFETLRPILLAGGSLRGHDTSALAAAAGLSEDALRAALHRLLREFRDSLRAEVRQTVENPAEVDDELDHLRRLFAR